MTPLADIPEAAPPASSTWARRGLRPAVAALLVAAAALRIRGGWNDLWLDEIWSLEIAREVRTPIDVFVRLHHEINHYLNTLWLWTAGDHGNWLGYRAPALVAGVAAVAVAGAIARRRGAPTLLFTLGVVASSYVLVLYSSEVRGYAALVLCSYLAFLLLGEALRRDDVRLGVAYAGCAVVGLLSHPLFTSVLLSALVWSAWHTIQRRLPLRSIAARLAVQHAVPFLCLAVLYWVDFRKVVVGGGTATDSLVASYGAALAWALGAPISGEAQLVACILAVFVLDLGIRLVRRDDPGEALFLLGVIVVFPVVLVIARGSPVLYTRHFLVTIAFVVLLLGHVLGALYERGPAGRLAAAGLLLAYVGVNGAHLRELFEHGRGENGEAIRFIIERSDPGPITIASDHDYRMQRIVEFYARDEPEGGRIEYEAQGTWRGAGPEWLIAHRDSFELPRSRGDEIHDDAGRTFVFVRAFPAAPLAGLHWFVYRNQAR